MKQVVIENPVINSAFKEPSRHFRFTDARTLWIPAINNHGGFGRWSFMEITDPWDAKNSIRKYPGQLFEEAVKP